VLGPAPASEEGRAALEVYETDRLDFAEAYLVASAESTQVGRIASFDQSTDRVETVERVEPPT
jgi:predicted nucleic acid-binding protein